MQTSARHTILSTIYTHIWDIPLHEIHTYDRFQANTHIHITIQPKTTTIIITTLEHLWNLSARMYTCSISCIYGIMSMYFHRIYTFSKRVSIVIARATVRSETLSPVPEPSVAATKLICGTTVSRRCHCALTSTTLSNPKCVFADSCCPKYTHTHTHPNMCMCVFIIVDLSYIYMYEYILQIDAVSIYINAPSSELPRSYFARK